MPAPSSFSRDPAAARMITEPPLVASGGRGEEVVGFRAAGAPGEQQKLSLARAMRPGFPAPGCPHPPPGGRAARVNGFDSMPPAPPPHERPPPAATRPRTLRRMDVIRMRRRIPGPPSAPNPPEKESRRSDRLRVLLVEDNPSDALVIRTLLTSGEQTRTLVAHAGTRQEALDLLADAAFDIILLDLFLPDARNLEALEGVRRHSPGVPVVVLTARDDEEVAAQAVRAGAQDYLCKGRIDADALLRSLRHAIERHRLLSRLEVALTRRDAAEEALHRREEYFRALIENASDVITVVEPDGRIRFMSASVEGVLGYAPEALLGIPGRDLVHPDDLRPLYRSFLRARRSTEFSPAVEYRARHRDGSWRTLHSVASNQFGNPAVRGLVVNSRDTTGRREAELDRERALSLLRATLEATADGILVVDRARTVVGYNQQFAKMWRVGEKVLTGRSADMLREYVLPQLRDPEAFSAGVEALNSDPSAEDFDILEFRDGRVFERYTKPQKIGGATVGRVWSFRDVTERRRLESRVLQSQKMEAVGQLAGGIAHDFNNILMTIEGTTALLLSDIPSAASFRGDLAEIARAADHAAGLTRQLLAFSRKQILQPEVTDLNRVISSMGQMLQRVLGAHVNIVCQPDPDLAPVRVDRGQMEQVLLNLALNARDAMPDGGTLVIRTCNVEPGDPRLAGGIPFPDGGVATEVCDDGIGMDAATLARIFEPFFTTKEAGRGTGLGLASVEGIVRQSGGDVLVESTRGVGTRFTVLLPRAADAAVWTHAPGRPAVPRVSPAPETADADRETTVLLVEDTDAVRRLARRVLERGHYRVLEAATPEEGLRIATTHDGPIHLLLTDVIMPGMNGPLLAERFLECRPGTPVIFMSGYAENSADVGPLAAGACLLQKPFGPAHLLEAVRRQLDAA
jgi:PAS domain S-box-containing protein